MAGGMFGFRAPGGAIPFIFGLACSALDLALGRKPEASRSGGFRGSFALAERPTDSRGLLLSPALASGDELVDGLVLPAELPAVVDG